jgi:hypothetical protein
VWRETEAMGGKALQEEKTRGILKLYYYCTFIHPQEIGVLILIAFSMMCRHCFFFFSFFFPISTPPSEYMYDPHTKTNREQDQNKGQLGRGHLEQYIFDIHERL